MMSWSLWNVWCFREKKCLANYVGDLILLVLNVVVFIIHFDDFFNPVNDNHGVGDVNLCCKK